ncbi:MAG: DUF433 domain-containing protein [Methanosarcinales archaeon]
MDLTNIKTKHPYITSKKGYCGGKPIIVGTKFPVRSVVIYVLGQGMTPEELVEEFPHLNIAQVYDVLSFYYDHKEEIDKEIEQSTEEYWILKTEGEKWRE